MSHIIFKKCSSLASLMLQTGVVHVWRLNQGTPDVQNFLSQEERLQTAKFVSKNAADLFSKGRSGIRRIASSYTSCEPSDLLISKEKNGKPFFLNNAEFHFNLSHSGNLVVAAVSLSHIGIDIERRGRCRKFLEIAQRFFEIHEASLISDANDKAEEVFLNLWTAKEAMLKLSGDGIAGGMHKAKVKDRARGMLDGKDVFLEQFYYDEYVGSIASFLPFEVKGWFDL